MKIISTLATTFIAISASAHAADIYDDYDAFYSTQTGALFKSPIKQDEENIYSNFGGNGIYTELKTSIDGKSEKIQVLSDHLIVNKNTHKFAQAMTFPNERAVDIYPGSARVFIAEATGNRPSLLCLEGNGSGSGEADRYQQVFLLMAPLARKPVFLHLPALLSSCRAVLATTNDKIAFPKNSYLFNEAKNTRIGLLVSYFTFDHGKFAPTGKEIRLHFINPENPFKFSRQD